MRDQFGEPSNILPINISQKKNYQGRGNFELLGEEKFTKGRGAVSESKKRKERNPKSISSPSSRQTPQLEPVGFFSFTHLLNRPPSPPHRPF
jgi:hypothetical protein